MMMSSCSMNSSMMNNVSNAKSAQPQVTNNQAKLEQTTSAQSDVAVQASIGSVTQTVSASESANVVKVYNPVGTLNVNNAPQTQTGRNLNFLA